MEHVSVTKLLYSLGAVQQNKLTGNETKLLFKSTKSTNILNFKIAKKNRSGDVIYSCIFMA